MSQPEPSPISSIWYPEPWLGLPPAAAAAATRPGEHWQRREPASHWCRGETREKAQGSCVWAQRARGCAASASTGGGLTLRECWCRRTEHEASGCAGPGFGSRGPRGGCASAVARGAGVLRACVASQVDFLPAGLVPECCFSW